MERRGWTRIACEPTRGYPAGPGYAYHCARCDGWLASMPSPDEPCACACGNLRVDVDAGRLSVDALDALAIYARDPR